MFINTANLEIQDHGLQISMFSMQDLGWRDHKRQCRSWGFFYHFSVEVFSASKPGATLLEQ